MIAKRQAGFTLVEVMVAVAVTTIVIIVLSDFMMRNLQSSTLEASQATLLSEVQLTLDNISTDIRLSADADATNRNPDPNSPGGSTNQFGWTSNSSTLVLATAATNTSRQMIFTDAANYITAKNNIVYFVSGGTLYKRSIATSVSGNSTKTSCPAAVASSSCPADKTMLHNVTTFQVTYLDGNSNVVSPANARSVQISLTAAQNKYHQTLSANYTTRMVFRNN